VEPLTEQLAPVAGLQPDVELTPPDGVSMETLANSAEAAASLGFQPLNAVTNQCDDPFFEKEEPATSGPQLIADVQSQIAKGHQAIGTPNQIDSARCPDADADRDPLDVWSQGSRLLTSEKVAIYPGFTHRKNIDKTQ